MNMAGLATVLQGLSTSGDQYNTTLAAYRRASNKISKTLEWIDEKLPALAESVGDTLRQESVAVRPLNVLSVGAGDGLIDSKILSHLRDRAHPKIHAVILEPDSHMMQQYRDLVSKESTKLQGVDFDWRQQTFQEYQTTATGDDKFHVIVCLASIFYCGDLEKSLKYLYERLEIGGLLLITLASGESGFGKLWHYLDITLGRKGNHLTSSDVEEVCGKLNIPIAEVQIIKESCDISHCFDPPDQLSTDGSNLLDFLTHTADFAQNAPVEFRDDVLRLLKSEACSERGSAGEVILDACASALVIRRQ